ncbi:MAG TPA: hypothetical protein VFC44_23635 [Candidatus Saccharimonadales bacterium]|nr:hypothetical protein [Candidatus Saccharimonadales bacterium]
MPYPTLPLPDLQALAESILGAIAWQDGTTGFCRCPGESQHTHPTHKGDCRVNLDGAPTIFCFHTSCTTDIEQVNKTLRSAAGKATRGSNSAFKRREPTPEEKQRQRQGMLCEQLKARAVASLPEILKAFEIGPADFWEMSPFRLLDDAADDWRLLLQLFKPDDVLWIGGKFDSCADHASETKKESCRRHFRPVADWLKGRQAPEQFTCPNVFKSGTHSRCNDAVRQRRYLVVESDLLAKAEMSAVINWCSQFMRLRAIVDTGGKSLHGWFDAPPPEIEAELKIILPNLGRRAEAKPTLDPALFKVAQPCRLPGAWREPGKIRQALLYLDMEAA